MLILTNTTDKLQVTTSAAADVDVHASWTDAPTPISPSSNVTPGRTNTAITTATTTDIVAAPAASTVRNVKTLHIENKDTADSTDVTVLYDQNGTDFVLRKATLAAGEALEYVEGIGWFEITPPVTQLPSGAATTAQIASHSADTYYLGFSIDTPDGVQRIKAGSYFRWEFVVTKGAAGTAAPVFTVRYGTAGTTADTSRAATTMSAQTAAADSGHVIVIATFRSVGSGSSAVLQMSTYLEHQLATTGLNSTTTGSQLVQNTGAGFDSTPAGSKIGLSVNPGASGAWVVEQVTLDAVNLAR